MSRGGGGRRLRILGGRYRGRWIEVAAGTRPSSGRLREALAGIWAERLPGCRFLDLFAGSGAVGLEAASRGAARVVLVEAEPAALAALERNLRRLDLPGVVARRAKLPGELPRALDPGEGFDLVFADPPYAFTGHADLLAACLPHLTAGGELALEHPARRPPPPAPAGLATIFDRRYGDGALRIYRSSTG